MQEWLSNNDLLMYSTHNQYRSVTTERFIKTLKTKIYKKITANDSKSCLSYLNKLLDQYNNIYHHSLNANYSAFTEKIETNPQGPKFKANERVRIT